MSSDSFVHLHVHTEYSMLDGAARLGDLFAEAARLGMPALAMTDHGNLYGAYDFYKRGKAAGVKPIIGIEGYYAPQGRFERSPFDFGGGYDEGTGEDGESTGKGRQAYTHMTLWAENNEGLHNLFRLSSLSSLEGFYRKPRMDRDLLQTYGKGHHRHHRLPVRRGQPLAAGRQLRPRARRRRRLPRHPRQGQLLLRADGPRPRHRAPAPRGPAADRALARAAAAWPPTTCTTSTRDDAESHDVLLCIGTRTTMDDPKRFRFDARDFYLKSRRRRCARSGPSCPRPCDNTLLIAERCNVSFNEGANLMPRFPVPEGESEESWLVKEVERGLAHALPRRRARTPTARRPSTRSASSARWASRATSSSPPTSCATPRRTASASARAAARRPARSSPTPSGITELDPIKHGLLFERFLNPERVSMPDIDMDFDERRRGDMIRYATEKYGEERVAQIITYGSIKAKAAIKDSARALGYPFAVGDRITKAMPPAVMGKDIPLAGIFDPKHPRYNEAQEFRALYEADADVRKVVDTAKGLEGLKRQPGVHAAGVILCSEPLLDVIPIWRRDQDGAIITQFDMGACETLGLLKMDFLGLRNLTVLDDCLQHIASNRGETVVLETLAARATARPTSCSPAATPSASSSSTAARCARCCARWRRTTSRTSPPSSRSTAPARWAPTPTTTTPTARTAASRSSRSTPSSPSRWPRSWATPTG